MKLYFCLIVIFITMTAAAQDSTYKEMAGTYKFPAGSVIPEAVVTFDNNILTMNSAEGASTLEKIKGDSFNIVNFSGLALFKRNDAKKIIGVHIEAAGYVFDGVKDTTYIAIFEYKKYAYLKNKRNKIIL